MSKINNHVDLRLIAQRVALENGFIINTGLDAIQQVKDITKNQENILSSVKAKDLTNLLWSSIDNTDSRDLDQIEYAEKLDGGDIRVVVGVADVDAFVPKGSPIDEAASKNTTSVYTGVVIYPMLPRELSEDITSLRQDVDRLSIIIDMVVNAEGAVKKTDFYQALVRNKAKLAYAAVGRWLDKEADRPSNDVSVPGLEDQLQLQYAESQRFHDLRMRQGALNLETIEARAVKDPDKDTVIDLVVNEENPAQDLIENFMVAANSSMAKFLDEHGTYSLRRIVKEPKRWPRIVELAERYGATLPAKPDGHALSAFLTQQRLKDPLRFPDLSLSIVKLLGRGEYTVVKSGQSHEGHFGLGIQDYTHSTAPNRRFPDLVTQRQLKAILQNKPSPYSEDELNEIATLCTQRENAASLVERFMRKAAAAVLLADRIGEVFEGLVTGAKDDGTYVRIFHPSAEGRIVQGEQGLDVGDKVNLRLVSTDPNKGFIDFKKA